MAGPNVVSTVEGVLKNNSATVRNIIATLFVFGLQALVSTEGLFKCPTKGNEAYGCMFIFVPALILFLISLLLSEDFRKVAQGCCYTVDPTKQIVRKYCPCSRPRWCCSEMMFKVFFYSLMASCLWIFWALLQKEYYTCAVVGSRELLKNITGQNKTKLEARFEKAGKISQIYGFSLLVVILGIPLLFLTVRRCCYLRPLSSIPSLAQYEQLEAESAEKKLKEDIQNYAKEQGEAKADKYFSQKIKTVKPTSDIIHEVHVDLAGIEGYSKPIKKALDEYKKEEANAVAEEFKTQAKELAKKRVTQTFKAKAWREYEDDDPYDFVEEVYESMSKEYPRVTGDQSKPYKYKQIGREEIEMAEHEPDEA